MPRREDERERIRETGDLRYCSVCKKFASSEEFYSKHYRKCFYVPEGKYGNSK